MEMVDEEPEATSTDLNGIKAQVNYWKERYLLTKERCAKYKEQYRRLKERMANLRDMLGK